jgi:hypothetical protein
MNVKKKILGAAGIVALGLAVVACGPTQKDDLTNTGNSYPNYQTTILNVDGFPNVSLLCFQGTAIITNTRDNTNMALAPTLNAYCATFIGQKAGISNPNTGNN